MTKEIYICQTGVIIVYKYPGKKRYVTHDFFGVHNGEMIDFFIDKEISMKDKLRQLKLEDI